MPRPFDLEDVDPGDRDDGATPVERDVLAGFVGLVVVACGAGWLAFLVWMALKPDTPNRWLLLPLALLGVPCFSFGRQWLLEGVGRAPDAIGRRWRRIAGGMVLALYGIAFVAASASVGSDDVATVGQAGAAVALVSFGSLLVAAGALLAIRLDPPLHIVRQLHVLAWLAASGSLVAVLAYGDAGVAVPGMVKLCALLGLVLVIDWTIAFLSRAR